MDTTNSYQLINTLKETNQILKTISNDLQNLVFVIAQQQRTTITEETNTTGNLFNM